MKKYAFFKYGQIKTDEKAVIIAEVEPIHINTDEIENNIIELITGQKPIKHNKYIIRNIPSENIIPEWLLKNINFQEVNDSEYGKIIFVRHVNSGIVRYIFEEVPEKGDLSVIEADDFNSAKLYFEINNK